MPFQTHSVRRSLARRALTEFLEHYHAERNHQGKGNVLLFHQQNFRRFHSDQRSDADSDSAAC